MKSWRLNNEIPGDMASSLSSVGNDRCTFLLSYALYDL